MSKSESIKELATALATAQARIKGAAKDSDNPFFKSKYADLSSVVEAIREPLASVGLSYVQISNSDTKDHVSIETIILHKSGEWLSCGPVMIPVNKVDAQGFGSAMTYARRYSLSAAFGVAPEDDDGNAAAKAKPAFASTHTPTSGAMESLPEDVQTFVLDAAFRVTSLWSKNDIAGAWDEYEAAKQSLEVEGQAALRSNLDSKVKTALRKHSEALKQAA
jgi:hypothetical protein